MEELEGGGEKKEGPKGGKRNARVEGKCEKRVRRRVWIFFRALCDWAVFVFLRCPGRAASHQGASQNQSRGQQVAEEAPTLWEEGSLPSVSLWYLATYLLRPGTCPV